MSDDRDIAAGVQAGLLAHQGVRAVELVGSRASGTVRPLSDWDFRVTVDDFAGVAADLPALVSGLEPLAQQWDRLSWFRCYMLMLAGPVKVDLLFVDVPQRPEPPWSVTPQSLEAIDQHFWDWVLWLLAKRQAGRDELVREELETMSRYLLEPMGIERVPDSIQAATADYRTTRDRLESQFGVAVPRLLELAVLPLVARR